MRLVALALVRNEAWVLRYSARVVLSWVDHLVILDHASTDATPEVISELADEHPGRITRLHEPGPTMNWMATRQRLLEEGRRQGGTAFVLWDADEILAAHLVPAIRSTIEALQTAWLLRMPWVNLWRGCDRYRSDQSKSGSTFIPMAFQDHPRLHWHLEEQLHHRDPDGIKSERRWPVRIVDGGLLHLQRANWGRAVARQSLYQMIELVRWPGRESVERVRSRYAASIDEHGAWLVSVPEGWWAHGLDRSLIDLEAPPWEAEECQRMLAMYGSERFVGLDLALP